jgi:FtsP/CotA-like multicopper oxidase with cupredoxin domain
MIEQHSYCISGCSHYMVCFNHEPTACAAYAFRNANRPVELDLPAGVHHDQLWGDLNLVNGQPWPFLDVTASWQRFRFLNADISRPRVLMVHFSSAHGH